MIFTKFTSRPPWNNSYLHNVTILGRKINTSTTRFILFPLVLHINHVDYDSENLLAMF